MTTEPANQTTAPSEETEVPQPATSPAAAPAEADSAKSIVSSAGALDETASTSPEQPAEAPQDGDAEKAESEPSATYEFSAPEGVELDTEVLGEFATIAGELKLPQDKAQAFVDLGVKLAAKWADSLVQAENEARAAWAKEIAADPAFAPERKAETLARIARARDAVKDRVPGLDTLLDEHGLGNHPTIVRLFAAFGDLVSEDKVVTSSSSPTQTVPLQERLYKR